MSHRQSNPPETLGSLISNILVSGRVLLEKAQTKGDEESWRAVLAYPGFWQVRHEDGIHSIKHMTDEDVAQSLVEDLLFCAIETARGSAASYPKSQATRHLGLAIEQAARIKTALEKILDSGMALIDDHGNLFVNPLKISEAQDFSGFYVFEWNPTSKDWVDMMLSEGGVELLGDALDDVVHAIEIDGAPKAAP